jgi:hypothetical protein
MGMSEHTQPYVVAHTNQYLAHALDELEASPCCSSDCAVWMGYRSIHALSAAVAIHPAKIISLFAYVCC